MWLRNEILYFFISRVIVSKILLKNRIDLGKLAEEQHIYNCSETSYNIITV